MIYRLWLPMVGPAIALLSLTIAPTMAIAQNNAIPAQGADKNGDFFNNSHTGKQANPTHGSLWRIRPKTLNCRQAPGVNQPIVRTFAQNTIVQPDLGRGGSDEVFINAKDSQGKRWMRVRSTQGKAYNCYIRANQQYIQRVK